MRGGQVRIQGTLSTIFTVVEMGFRGRAKGGIHKTVSYSLKLNPRKTVRLRETGNDHQEDGFEAERL